MQSHLRRRKKAGGARCGQAIEGPGQTLGQISPSRGGTGARAGGRGRRQWPRRSMLAKLAEWHVTPIEERLTARVLTIARITTITSAYCFVCRSHLRATWGEDHQRLRVG